MAKELRRKQLNLTFYLEHHESIRKLYQRLLMDPEFIIKLDKLLINPTGPQLERFEERLARLERALAASGSARENTTHKSRLPSKNESPIEDEFVDRRYTPVRVWPAGVREIHRQFVAGKTDRQIGESLGLARRTINKRRKEWKERKLKDQEPAEES